MSGEPAPAAGDFPLKIHTENCGDCVFCVSVCPFEALKSDEKTKKVQLDKEKCKLCGLCYTSCPAGQIDVAYYDKGKLLDRLERTMGGNDAKTLVLACRGSEPRREAIVAELGSDRFIELTLPCVGRLPMAFFLAAAEKGIEKIAIFSCEEDYCRFKKGATAIGNTVTGASVLLSDMGYPEDIITLKRGAHRVIPDTENRCISCGNCVTMCPYQGVKLDSGAAKFDMALCKGCGICVAECPKMCLELQGSESVKIAKEIADFSSVAGGPKVISFVCSWSEFTALDLADLTPNLKLVPLPCAGRVEMVDILSALLNGIDGVLVVTCLDGECKQEKSGDKHARRYEEKLRTHLKSVGISERVAVISASPKQMGRFKEGLEQFTAHIGNLGRLKLSDRQREALTIFKSVCMDVRIRWLFAREKEILEKGNAYGEKVPAETWSRFVEEALADRLIQHSILHHARERPMSPAELAKLVGLDPPVVLRHLIDLKRRNLIFMRHQHGQQLFTARSEG